ncbi:trypsin-like peptidase domain-containing protein [Spirulina sp. 06S082]|uniref:trypsin-like peptidase domain-containing protein n=1 Tax=Spirulina sp. 06S082 TaxID=3110248 RepID=UPI002B1F1739|nr:trypsin-like peptidase domain-containing protein [Spirulina sp. 06S082]MEA5467724.1 trypsin-like peptidase domain-containing protein [Spirulina sp. 06S082]
MVALNAGDRKQLIALLKDLPELEDERSRQEFLEYVDLGDFVSKIDLSGKQFVAVSAIVRYLSQYGRLRSNGCEALGIFLDGLRDSVGGENGAFLEALLTKYNMMTPTVMTPVVALPPIVRWEGQEQPEQVYEKIIGENTLRPIAFLQQGLDVAQSVAYIGVRGDGKQWSGTGFLVAESLLLTNNHVLEKRELLSGAIFRFNYEENFRGEAQAVDEYRAKEKGIFQTNSDLDYTLVELENTPGRKWKWLRLREREIRRNNRINIIQHPGGQPKQISLQNNFVQYIGENVVQYVTSTLNGSSGSPVFNDSWEVIAVHHAGGDIPEPTTQRRYFRNEGILIERILADLPSDIQARLND